MNLYRTKNKQRVVAWGQRTSHLIYNPVLPSNQPIPIPEPNNQSPRVPTLTGRVNPLMPPPPNSATTNRHSRPPPKPSLAASPLHKHKSWSPDILRDEEWVKRKDKQLHRRQNKSVTDEDIDELKASIELGFGFNESNDRLSNTLPALGLYYAVNRNYQHTISKSSSVSSSSSSLISDSDSSAPVDGPQALFDRGNSIFLFELEVFHFIFC